ncbi:MAG: hypothetical protein HKP55_05125 [Gammaproteobacteria bacterium]|nr:hypothetical protein [Gammaproteobacteria bacterium]
MVAEVNKQKLSVVVMAAFLIVPVIIFAFFVWRETTLDAVETGVVDSTCDVHNATCEARFNHGGRLLFSMNPRPIKPLTQLELQVQLSNMNAQQVLVDFQGIGIDMGFYRPELKRDNDGFFSGQASLSVCTLDKMLWQATVIVKSEKGVMIAPFRFEVEQP